MRITCLARRSLQFFNSNLFILSLSLLHQSIFHAIFHWVDFSLLVSFFLLSLARCADAHLCSVDARGALLSFFTCDPTHSRNLTVLHDRLPRYKFLFFLFSFVCHTWWKARRVTTINIECTLLGKNVTNISSAFSLLHWSDYPDNGIYFSSIYLFLSATSPSHYCCLLREEIYSTNELRLTIVTDRFTSCGVFFFSIFRSFIQEDIFFSLTHTEHLTLQMSSWERRRRRRRGEKRVNKIHSLHSPCSNNLHVFILLLLG